MINLSLKNLTFNIKTYESKYKKKINQIKDNISIDKNDNTKMTGWLNWPSTDFYKTDYKKINEIYNSWKDEKISKYVVIGIGGSYIGIKAGLKMCCDEQEYSKFIFISSLDQEYVIDVLMNLKKENWALIVISKSGSTLETSVNFRIFREAIYKRYGNKHNDRIVAITGNEEKLYSLAIKNKYHILNIENNIGGRFSTLTSVGLLVFKLANLNIKSMLDAWSNLIEKFLANKFYAPIEYALIRYVMLTNKNKGVEVFSTYNEKLYFISEHYKQIFAESEGKCKCLIPTIANYSVDLHSIGQLYQQGPNNFFETHLSYKSKPKVLKVNKSSFGNDDGLDKYLKLSLFDIENAIRKGVIIAHSKHAKTPCVEIIMDDMSEKSFAELIAFLDLSAYCSSLFLNVNPFDQPGVESYKFEIKKILNNI